MAFLSKDEGRKLIVRERKLGLYGRYEHCLNENDLAGTTSAGQLFGISSISCTPFQKATASNVDFQAFIEQKREKRMSHEDAGSDLAGEDKNIQAYSVL